MQPGKTCRQPTHNIEMSQHYLLSKKASIIVYCVFGIIFLFGMAFFVMKYRQSQKETAQLIEQKVSGKIIEVDDLGKGFVSLIIITESNTRFETTGLLIASEIKKFGIRKGDSLFKASKSDNILFYRKNANGYKQIGEAKFSIHV
jgi:hypothetical protein